MKMKMWSVIALLLAVEVADAVAHAQMPSRDQLVASALDNYGKISSGMYLNQRCKFLEANKAASFETNVADIKNVLGKDIGNPGLLDKIDEGAKRVANSDKYKSCGDDAKNIVEKASAYADSWSAHMREIQSGQKSN
jgi:hypothetical protein